MTTIDYRRPWKETVRCAKGHEYERSTMGYDVITFQGNDGAILGTVELGCLVCLAERLQAMCEPVEVVK